MKARNLVPWGSINVPLDRMSFTDKLFVWASLVGVLILSLPHITAAQVVRETPLIFQVNEVNLGQLSGAQKNYLAEVLAEDVPPVYEDPRIAVLREFLRSKNSPLAEDAQTLLSQYHYRLIIGISFAESNFCKIQIRENNCWGIGGRYPESYETLTDGIIRANNLIEKYHHNGMTTAKLMRTRWVGWHNDRWILAVEQVASDMENRGL